MAVWQDGGRKNGGSEDRKKVLGCCLFFEPIVFAALHEAALLVSSDSAVCPFSQLWKIAHFLDGKGLCFYLLKVC